MMLNDLGQTASTQHNQYYGTFEPVSHCANLLEHDGVGLAYAPAYKVLGDDYHIPATSFGHKTAKLIGGGYCYKKLVYTI
jgi:hypothetical protein